MMILYIYIAYAIVMIVTGIISYKYFSKYYNQVVTPSDQEHKDINTNEIPKFKLVNSFFDKE